MQNVQGFGGFFFRAKDPERLAKWYHDHLGINPAPTNMEMAALGDRVRGHGFLTLRY